MAEDFYSKPHLNGSQCGGGGRYTSAFVQVCRQSMLPTRVIGKMSLCSDISGLEATGVCGRWDLDGPRSPYPIPPTPPPAVIKALCTIHVKKEHTSSSYYPPSAAPLWLPVGILIIFCFSTLSGTQKWNLSWCFGGSHMAWHMAATLARRWIEAALASRWKPGQFEVALTSKVLTRTRFRCHRAARESCVLVAEV